MEFSRLSPERLEIIRVLDANANRASEGLRVVEEYFRFVRQDRYLSSECKQIRHELTSLMAQLDVDLRVGRDAERDIGRETQTEQEYQRVDLEAVLTANLSRLQQALRCLEEYGKIIAPKVAQGLENLRYRSYTLERAIQLFQRAEIQIDDADLYVLIDGAESEIEFEQRLKSLITAGPDLIQLRDKRLDDRIMLERAHRLRQLTRDTEILMIINDRPDLALLSDADGVHLGQDDMSPAEARQILGPDRIIGLSTHSVVQAQKAVGEDISYIGVGPTFASTTKEFDDFPGPNLLQQVASEISLPAFAIGGIGLDQIATVLETGIHRVAVGAAIWQANQPGEQAVEFKSRLQITASMGENR